MDVSSMLSNAAPDQPESSDARRLNHQYPTRHAALGSEQNTFAKPYHPSMQRPSRGNGVASAYTRTSPVKKNQKHVLFQLIDHEDPRIQARLPMRVMISTHDTTDSIITTVKNFYGLYEYGVSFENKDGVGIIAACDNFENDMIVYVRTVAQNGTSRNERLLDAASPNKPTLGAPIEMRQTQHGLTQSPLRLGARSVGARSMSPQSDIGQRSASAAPGGKPRTHRIKSKDNSVYGDGEGYSSGDNGEGSVASSRRSKAEVVNAEISVDNIVEGGRRKGAFESSELPLFVPPQVPMTTSISSISPQRRAGPPSAISPYPYSNQQTFSYAQPLPSPQSYGSGALQLKSSTSTNSYSGSATQQGRHLRGRPGAIAYPSHRQSVGGVLPTPDPTVGSAISDEDVALQLMRLGDPMAFSHGRTSTSTVDDGMSGKAELASSDEEDDEDEDDESDLPVASHHPKGDSAPPRKKQRVMNEPFSDATSGDEYEDRRDGTFNGSDHLTSEFDAQRKANKSKSSKHRNSLPGTLNPGKPRANSLAKPKSKTLPHAKTPMSPSSMPAPSRNASISSLTAFQHQLGTDEEDLSSKPRCQRCRKSKKGCDRQRPCGRCKDAGIGIEGCISEDEGNGRKGRYGRHMGVSVKRAEETLPAEPPAAPLTSAPANGVFLAPALPDKSKKRKR